MLLSKKHKRTQHVTIKSNDVIIILPDVSMPLQTICLSLITVWPLHHLQTKEIMLLQQSSTPLLVLLAVCVTVSYTAAFSTIYQQTSAFKVSKISKLFSTPTEVSTYSLELEKPLGIVLEEVTENASDGVYVESVNEGGSAYEYAEKLQGLKLMKVMDDDVTSITFDEVMVCSLSLCYAH